MSPTTPDISVVVPVYNEEAVAEAFFTELQQLLHTLANNFEIVVVDDGSRDATVAKLRDAVGVLRQDGTYDKIYEKYFGHFPGE